MQKTESNLTNLHNALALLTQIVKNQVMCGMISPYPCKQIYDVAKTMKDSEPQAHNPTDNVPDECSILFIEDYPHLKKETK